MKKITLLLISCFLACIVTAQTDGISYQAVIIDNNPQEIPGVDIPSNNLPNVPLKVQFSIIDNTNAIEYQESHDTTTDPYGMINLMVGQGASSIGEFNEIYWNNSKYLKVDIDLFDGNGFVEFSYQELTYIPYVKHREIIATSTLDVDGATNLNNSFTVNNESPSHLTGSLIVDGETNLNNNLNVNNQATTTLSGDLYVEGTAHFTDGVFDNITVNEHSALNTLTADGETNINNAFKVNNESPTELTGSLDVAGVSHLQDVVRIDATTIQTDENQYGSYPLQVQGSEQGIAIKLNANNPDRTKNYLSFWAGNNQVRGRIEGNNYLEPVAFDFLIDIIDPPGVTDLIDLFIDFTPEPEFGFDPEELIEDVFENEYYQNDFSFTAYHYTMDFVVSIQRLGVNLVAATGFCATGDCDDAIWSFIDMAVDGMQLAEWYLYNAINIGVAFESGSADYAEWLKKYDENEVFAFGDVVGVKGGLISKSFVTAENYMIVSQNPLISGAMPKEDETHLYERIAFMGQVPVKVIGKANKGDYILPSGHGDGLAIAVRPNDMKINDYKRIIGVSWGESSGEKLFTYVNTAVGINTNDMAGVVSQMQGLMNNMQLSLAKLDTNYKPYFFEVEDDFEDRLTEVTLVDINNTYMVEGKNQRERLEKLSQKTFNQFKNSDFDFSRFPFLMETIQNPTKENGEKLVAYYSKVIERLEAIKPNKE